MGVVWRARDELLDREVAVKQLRLPDLGPDEGRVARARAMREARNAARLHHPGAIAVFDVVVEDDRPWLVMEYLPARSLAGLLAERGRLEPAEAAGIGAQVAAALAAAHAAGIVHRDVKPSNVLIGHDGTVKLTDFGISRAAGDGTLTDSGMITGTPAYLAPEVARGEQPDTASDVFSLGATLYAATEGRSPYGTSDNSFGLLYRAAAGRVEPPARAGELTGLLTRMLATDRDARPTADQAAALLADPADPRAEAPPAGSPARPRRRWLAPLVAAVVAVLGAGAVAAASLLLPLDGSSGGQASTVTTSPPPPVPTAEAGELVLRHYDLLPEDPRAAYDNLTASYRQSFEDYAAFWGQYDDVRASLAETWQDGTHTWVQVVVTFVRGGVESSGRYLLRVEPDQGRLRIAAAEERP
ncbi:serine/threonine protein kinase [Saccharothrix syringae]|uniref:non-specific serine/threonine protein kinase n=2 Tax=Saccharothrix syringae TaxID=103733 RepID=A0A5Q0HFR3_SACSY|nr:serine/threonine protein kinase [Saccharothrix syringae]